MVSKKMIVEPIVLISDLVEAAAPQVMTPCGTIFCGTHRYPEVHACTFDFKSMGREAIAKANPLIKAEKLKKI
ncbi:hypothetical protein H5410_014301 [Solanum commersonii]|uniref:AN1-type domain-containing protein n=1 Tax=Solanum commersonii TaxID=4109 RepID=A0A9J5ZQI9_SOLCO|nr:hypothetical protein H5410_014301 [Solanum commersonii]